MTRDPALSFNAWLRWDVIRGLLRRVGGARSFLEIGCGGGAMGARLARRYEYVGYEPDVRSYERARRRIGARGRVVNDVLPERPTRAFDLVGAFEVLEHLREDETALRAWRARVRPGGHLLLSVPAKAARYGPCDAAMGHFRRYEPDGLVELLEECGCERPLLRTYGFPLGYALEAVRNRIVSGRVEAPSAAEPGAATQAAAGRSAAGRTAAGPSAAERTAASGRFLQPDDGLAWLTSLGTLPFRLAQRPFTRTRLGTGLVALARRRE